MALFVLPPIAYASTPATNAHNEYVRRTRGTERMIEFYGICVGSKHEVWLNKLEQNKLNMVKRIRGLTHVHGLCAVCVIHVLVFVIMICARIQISFLLG